MKISNSFLWIRILNWKHIIYKINLKKKNTFVAIANPFRFEIVKEEKKMADHSIEMNMNEFNDVLNTLKNKFDLFGDSALNIFKEFASGIFFFYCCWCCLFRVYGIFFFQTFQSQIVAESRCGSNGRDGRQCAHNWHWRVSAGRLNSNPKGVRELEEHAERVLQFDCRSRTLQENGEKNERESIKFHSKFKWTNKNEVSSKHFDI